MGSGTAPAPPSAGGDAGPHDRAAHQVRQRRDEGRMGAERGDARVTRNTGFLGEGAAGHVQFHQGLRMLGHEGDRRNHQGNPVAARARDLLQRRRADPGQRTHPAL